MQQLKHHQRSAAVGAMAPTAAPIRRCEGTAMGAITLDLRPGLGLGPFTLGMPICEAFAQIEHKPNIYDVVHVKYFDEEPLKLDIVISFPDHGFHLRFDPWSQRLRLIEVYDVKRLQMRYATSLIGGPSTLATFVAVYSLFGPTFPGIYDKDRGVYTLFYPGLSFAFPIPSQYTNCCHDVDVSAELPLEFPDGTTPVTCRVSVYDSTTETKVGVGSLMDKASVPPLPTGSLYMEEVHAKLGEELWFSIGGQHIPFGASPQDVWTELGRSCGIHQKQVNARILFVDPSTRAVGLTMNGYLLQNKAPPIYAKTGDIYDHSRIVRVDRGAGLLLEIPSDSAPSPAYVNIFDIADEEIRKLEKKFKEGSYVRVCILAYRHLEGLAMGTLKASAFVGSVFTHSDVKPGMLVKAKAIAVESFGAIVQFSGGVKVGAELLF